MFVSGFCDIRTNTICDAWLTIKQAGSSQNDVLITYNRKINNWIDRNEWKYTTNNKSQKIRIINDKQMINYVH